MAFDVLNSIVSVGLDHITTCDTVSLEVRIFDVPSAVLSIIIICYSRVELARIPEKVCYVIAEVWVTHDFFEFLASFVALGHYGGPDEVRRAEDEQVLTCETAACNISAAHSKGEVEDLCIQLFGQFLERYF